MTRFRHAILGLCLLLTCACQSDSQASAQSPAPPPVVTVSSDVTLLGKLVTLETKPSSVVFRHERRVGSEGAVPGPTDSSIVAVLRYGAAQAQALCAATPTAPAADRLPTADWFPPELTALATTTTDGRSVLTVKRCPADAFKRSPYLNGVLMRVGDSPYLVVSLYTT